jgi:predicted metal-dependent phosphoesterase TrpH
VHLLAYLPDPTHPELVEELDRVLDGRNDRLPATLDRLRGLGIDIEADDVRRLAGDAAALGRPHVADALVEAGVVRDRDQAFAEYLGPQGPAYVDRYAADLVTMLGTVAAAGGVSVIAHPWASRYKHTALDEAGLAALQEHGLAGIEVAHEDHDADVRAVLHGIARNLGLVETGSSDYHGLGKTGHDLACNTTEPDQLARLLELAADAASRSRRPTPEVVAG